MSNNCVFPETRPTNVWVVYSVHGERLGEVAANSENEARALVMTQLPIPFRLSHVEE
jgi:hypothetical protein